MLSQVLRDWIGTEVEFHTPVVLRLHGESSRDLGGVCQLCAQGDPVLALTGRDLGPWSGQFSAVVYISNAIPKAPYTLPPNPSP